MSEPVFTAGSIPDTDETPDGSPVAQARAAGDLHCRVCDKPLEYSGRGRKPTLCDEHKRQASSPRTGTATVKADSDVQRAVLALQGMYDGLAMALMFVSPAAASAWQERVPVLQDQNRAILTVDKDLCKSINRVGAKGGKATFVTAHVIAVGPVVMIAQQDIAQRSAERLAAQEAARADEPAQQNLF